MLINLYITSLSRTRIKKEERALLQTASFYMKAGLLREFITVTKHSNNMFCGQSPCIAYDKNYHKRNVLRRCEKLKPY